MHKMQTTRPLLLRSQCVRSSLVRSGLVGAMGICIASEAAKRRGFEHLARGNMHKKYVGIFEKVDADLVTSARLHMTQMLHHR